MSDLHACQSCGALTDINLLDGKPEALKGIKTTAEDLIAHECDDFTVLECRDCYGPAWCAGP
ncbi:hypothetical protein HGG70_07350 [Rhodobacteraceae bacterium R_SAG4]|nr:hypothetical protein [Rhodobacteraceae bacterium R_SAG4]